MFQVSSYKLPARTTDVVPRQNGSPSGRPGRTGVGLESGGQEKGFTLIELLVSVSLYAIFVTIATGLFLSSIQGQRKIFSFQAVQDNSRYVTEFMAREMRMGKNFLVTGGNNLNFVNQKGEIIYYCMANNSIKRAVGAFCDANSSNLTSSEVVVVDKLEFLLSGEGVGDLRQPRITIIMKLHSSGTVSAVETSLNLQTTVSARKLES